MAQHVGIKAFFYSRWRGRFEVREGYVLMSNFSNTHANFYTEGPKGRRWQCGSEAGVVYNATVWFRERNDDEARRLFIEYEETCIEALEEKIKNHRWNIELLKEMGVHENLGR